MSTSKGFSLLELLITVLVLAIIVFAIISLVRNPSEDAKIVKIRDSIRVLERVIQRFEWDTGYFPSAIEQLWKNEDRTGNFIPNWNGPYLKPAKTRNGDLVLFEKIAVNVVCTQGTNGSFSFVVKNISPSFAVAYDKKFDDGNISTGNAVYDRSSYTLKVRFLSAQDTHSGVRLLRAWRRS